MRVLDRGIGRGFYKEEEKPAALSRIRTTTALDDFADRDFVTEAVFENEAVKAEVYRALDRVCPPGCILASNTSTIPISTLASYVGEARHPYFIGTHYFSPASRMKLVEVIPAFETASETVETALRLTREADKVPVKVKDVAGFAVNRMFLIFLQEAVRLVDEGVSTVEDIDTACKLGLGHPMGPFELMDATTSRLVLQASEILFDALAAVPAPAPPNSGCAPACQRPRQHGLAEVAADRHFGRDSAGNAFRHSPGGRSRHRDRGPAMPLAAAAVACAGGDAAGAAVGA
jgi:3-hydroxybutyryl-CoA dehydrogenase